MVDPVKLRQVIIDLSISHGFDAVGFAPVKRLDDDADFLKDWLNKGMHADMRYMENHFDKRVNPALLVPGAKTVVVFLKNYFPAEEPAGAEYKIAKYAFGRDYHKVIRKKLKIILRELHENYGVSGRLFVDSAPVLERALARRAGLGFVGKNTMLINKDIGSFCFISELVIDTELGEGDEVIDACGNCRRCIDACPTSAIVGPRILDSNKCISYLTIEKKNAFDDSEIELMQQDKYIFGCDICQDVCPWNNKATSTTETDFLSRDGVRLWSNEEWHHLSANQFFDMFAGTPLMRAGYEQMVRNVESLRKGKVNDKKSTL